MYVQGYLQGSENGRVVTIGEIVQLLKNEREKKVTRFGFLDGCQHSRQSNCLKTEEEPHKLIV